ncbi:MAG: hypothetical protein HC896_12230 [Bacteroidales bacterium]|nr:hypothetical protein [Bacteroidales bacterium]
MYAGTFTVTVTDAKGCAADSTIVLTQPADINFAVIVTDASNIATNDGSIDLTTTGGNGGFDWAWSGPASFTATTQDISNLYGGEYSVYVFDQFGCAGDTIIDVGANTFNIFMSGLTNVDCFGEATGAATINIENGSGLYQIFWMNQYSDTIATDVLTVDTLRGGTYVVMAYDLADPVNLKDSSIFEIETPTSALGIQSATPTNPTCYGFSNGSVNIVVTGAHNLIPITGPMGQAAKISLVCRQAVRHTA